MPEAVDPVVVMVQFNECINDQDIGGLASLMTDDHEFVDTEGGTVRGKGECLEVWQAFFALFPDYRNIFEAVQTQDGVAIALGYSRCSDKRLDGPAIWTANVRNGAIVEWRVYEDTSENRRLLSISG
jgi:ketosteroid isomerase-like protein